MINRDWWSENNSSKLNQSSHWNNSSLGCRNQQEQVRNVYLNHDRKKENLPRGRVQVYWSWPTFQAETISWVASLVIQIGSTKISK